MTAQNSMTGPTLSASVTTIVRMRGSCASCAKMSTMSAMRTAPCSATYALCSCTSSRTTNAARVSARSPPLSSGRRYRPGSRGPGAASLGRAAQVRAGKPVGNLYQWLHVCMSLMHVMLGKVLGCISGDRGFRGGH